MQPAGVMRLLLPRLAELPDIPYDLATLGQMLLSAAKYGGGVKRWGKSQAQSSVSQVGKKAGYFRKRFSLTQKVPSPPPSPAPHAHAHTHSHKQTGDLSSELIRKMIGMCGMCSGSIYSVENVFITAKWHTIVPFASSVLFSRVIFYSITFIQDVY